MKIIGAGSVMVTAQIAGDEKCNGTTVTRKITIGKAAAPQIIWPTASSVEAGSSLSASVLAGGSTEYGSLPGKIQRSWQKQEHTAMKWNSHRMQGQP